MKKQPLTFTFHNPNTEEVTVKHITKLFAEVALAKVIAAQEKMLTESPKAV